MMDSTLTILVSYFLGFILLYIGGPIIAIIISLILQLVFLPISFLLKLLFGTPSANLFVDKIKYLSTFFQWPISFLGVMYIFKIFKSTVPVFFILIFILWRIYGMYVQSRNPVNNQKDENAMIASEIFGITFLIIQFINIKSPSWLLDRQ